MRVSQCCVVRVGFAYCLLGSDEELTTVCVGASVGHAHRVRLVVLQAAELVLKLSSPDTLASCSVA